MGWVFAKPSALLQVVGGDMMAPTALKGPRFSSEQNCACACLCVLYSVKCYACSCWQAPVFSLHEVAIWSLIGQRCHSTTKWSQMAVKTRRGWRLAIVANQGEEVVCNKYCQEQNKISWYPVDAILSSHPTLWFFLLMATNGKEQDQRPTSLLIICDKYWKGEEPGDSIELEHILTKSRTRSTCAQLTLVNFSHPFYWLLAINISARRKTSQLVLSFICGKYWKGAKLDGERSQ